MDLDIRYVLLPILFVSFLVCFLLNQLKIFLIIFVILLVIFIIDKSRTNKLFSKMHNDAYYRKKKEKETKDNNESENDS